MNDAELFWKNTNALIKSRNTTQAALSAQCGFNARRIQNLSAGNRLPDAAEACRIAEALGVSVEFLVSGGEAHARPDKSRVFSALESLRREIDAL